MNKIIFKILTLLLVCMIGCSSTGSTRRGAGETNSPRESLRRDRSQANAMNTLYGKASYYADKFHGRKTASGEIFDMNGLTAAHKSLPFGTICRVTNLENGKKVIVKINDRGPFVGDRILDLSKGAALALGSLQSGVIEVKIEILSMPE